LILELLLTAAESVVVVLEMEGVGLPCIDPPLPVCDNGGECGGGGDVGLVRLVLMVVVVGVGVVAGGRGGGLLAGGGTDGLPGVLEEEKRR